MSTIRIHNNIIQVASTHLLANVEGRPTPTNPDAALHIDTLSGIGARRLREVITISVLLPTQIILPSPVHCYVNWLPFFRMPNVYRLCATARLCLASMFPRRIVDMIMLRFFHNLNVYFNSDDFAYRLMRFGAVNTRTAYFNIRALRY